MGWNLTAHPSDTSSPTGLHGLTQEHLALRVKAYHQVTSHNKPYTRDLFRGTVWLPQNGKRDSRGSGRGSGFYRFFWGMLRDLVEKYRVAWSTVWLLMLSHPHREFPSLRSSRSSQGQGVFPFALVSDLGSNQGQGVHSLAPPPPLAVLILSKQFYPLGTTHSSIGTFLTTTCLKKIERRKEKRKEKKKRVRLNVTISFGSRPKSPRGQHHTSLWN